MCPATVFSTPDEADMLFLGPRFQFMMTLQVSMMLNWEKRDSSLDTAKGVDMEHYDMKILLKMVSFRIY